MIKKKMLGALAGLAVAVLSVQACSTDSAGEAGAVDGSGQTLNVLIAANTLYPTEQQAWFDDVSATFEAETGATVEFETFASANDELTKIQTSVLSGQGPDVYSLGTTFTPTAYSTGAFVTLGDEQWEQVGGRDKFVEASLGISGPDEENEIGVPLASRPFGLAYNTELLEAAGFDAPADSWDGLVEQAKAMTHDDQYGMAIAYADSYNPWKFIWSMSLQAGNPLIDGDTATLDDEATFDAYTSYFEWMTVDKVVDPASVGWQNAQAVAAFADGKAAFLPMTTATSSVTFDASDVAGKYAFATLPLIPPGETSAPSDSIAAATIISGDNIVVANYSPNQDLAFAFIKLLTDPAQQEIYFNTFGEMPTNAEAAATIESENELLAPLLEAGSLAVGTPFSGAWGDVQLALGNVAVQLIPDMQSGGVSDSALQAQLDAAQTAAQSALDRAQ
ncbi:extracellular solute-binding protein [Salinibacterium sp. NK8237]|uniref:sugar ABC transporter substrate-binding protein n=1 Tax=Salinibacterium sp. NK8237 TaxID=2792038 RepID=UPI0018CE98FD|nr:extracellular solute-binding protein [Salinibacterium sp. NK8237]MBH0131155.1 extracellular solute-binding protein [Salinibacterium sp. NK8237]